MESALSAERCPAASASSIGMRRVDPTESLEPLTAMLHRAFSGLGRMGLNCTCVDQSAQVTRERIAKGECYAASHDGRLVGTVTLYAPDPDSPSTWYHRADVASVHQLAVAPEYQCSGVGASLLHFAESWATGRGYAELALDTAQPARHLLAFYKRHRYRFVESVRFPGKAYFSVVLSKDLRAPKNAWISSNSACKARSWRGLQGS